MSSKFGERAFGAVLVQVFDEMVEAVLVADDNRRILIANPAAVALFGYTEQELLGQSSHTLYASSADFEEMGRSRYNPTSIAHHDSYIKRYRRRDGTVFEGETIGGPIRDSDSGDVLFFGIVRDVTTRVSAERVLNRLHRITSDRSLDFEKRQVAVLELGCEHFGLPIGIFSRIEGDRYEVVQAVHPEHALTAGAVFNLGETYCCHTLQADGPLGFHHVADSNIRDHPCYQAFGLESYLGCPILVDGVRFGTLNFSSPAPTRAFNGQDLELVQLFADWMGHEIARQADLDALAQTHARLEQVATTDELTGLANRRLLTARLGEELDRAARYGGKLAIALIDFDHFKRLNDQYGHDAGDAALVLFAKLARQSVRTTDLAGRWGGEEFMVLLPNTSRDGAVVIAERLGSAVRDNPLSVQGRNIGLSVSTGVAVSRHGDTAEALVKRADQALYDAKAQGRDCVRTAQ